MYRRIIAVGDIHGNFTRFQSLWNGLDYKPEQDLLIFLGDYIDRGSKSLPMLDWLMEHRSERVIVLRGNHEQMLLEVMNADAEMQDWLDPCNGNDSTFDSLADDWGKWDTYAAFIESLPLSYQLKVKGKQYFFCHAGVRPGVPLREQGEEELLWIREDYYEDYEGDDVIVSGHTPVQYIQSGCTKPIIKRNMIQLDTGAYQDRGMGFISAVDVLTGECWQSAADLDGD